MKLPRQVANPGLAALIDGSGYPSLERFAIAINVRGWDVHGVKLSYDHVSVKRWLGGSVCENPDVVAEVLSEAWGVPVPVAVIWPELRDGRQPVPAHLQPWVVARTLEELGIFLRSDMLTRRETLTGAVRVLSGPALLAPIARWLGAQPGRLTAPAYGGQRIGVGEVAAIENSSRYFAATDAESGGGLSREAAVGQLKYAVDLARHASYSDAIGNRLLAAIAKLSGLVGYLCQDSGMPGPALRYFTYGLQAARASTDERAPLLVVSILADMAQHMRWLSRPNTALRLHDLASSQLPTDRSRFTVVRAVLASKRAEDGLCFLGSSCRTEMQNTLQLAFDLYAQATDEDYAVATAGWHRALDFSEAGTHGRAAAAYLVLAKDDPQLTEQAEASTRYMLANVEPGQERDKLLSQIRLTRIRFVAGEPDQGCDDGNQALDAAEDSPSTMVKARLRELLEDTRPYGEMAGVRELRERVRGLVR